MANLDMQTETGWLWKLGGQGLLANWKRRFFQVKGDMLYYYTDDTCKDLCGQFMLCGNEVIKHTELDLKNPDRKYKFEIIPGRDKEGPVKGSHDTFLLATSTAEDMQNWIKLFHKIIYAPVGGGMFGRPLKETVESEKKKSGGFIPIIVDKCIHYIKEKGLLEEGIFRLAGNAGEVEALKNAFNCGENPELLAHLDVHAVASVLKQYFRELPEPVIPYDYFCLFMAASRKFDEDEREGLGLYFSYLRRIPKCNYNLLKFLCRFLYEIQEKSDTNKMNASNLGTVFGPNLLSPKTLDHHVIMENTSTVVKVISSFILHHGILFPSSVDEQCYRPSHVTPVCEGSLVELDDFESSSVTLPNFPKSNSGLLMSPVSLQRTNSLPNNVDKQRVQAPVPPVRSKNQLSNGRKSRPETEKLEQLCDSYQNKILELQNELYEEKKVKDALMLALQDERRKRLALEERVQHLKGGLEDFLKEHGIDLTQPEVCNGPDTK